MNIRFENLNQLMSFLFNTQDWQEWEVIKLHMSNVIGLSIIVNTKINDPAGKIDYQQLNKLKSVINSFLVENSNVSIMIDLKLKASKELKAIIDPQNEYSNFFVDFFGTEQNSLITVTQVERKLGVSIQPIELWNSFINTRYNEWLIDTNYNNN